MSDALHHLPALVVRIDQVIAAEQSALLHDRVRARIETGAEAAALALGVDPAAVSIEEQPRVVPMPMTIHLAPGVTPRQFAEEVQRRWVLRLGEDLDDVEAAEAGGAAVPARPRRRRRLLDFLRGGG